MALISPLIHPPTMKTSFSTFLWIVMVVVEKPERRGVIEGQGRRISSSGDEDEGQQSRGGGGAENGDGDDDGNDNDDLLSYSPQEGGAAVNEARSDSEDSLPSGGNAVDVDEDQSQGSQDNPDGGGDQREEHEVSVAPVGGFRVRVDADGNEVFEFALLQIQMSFPPTKQKHLKT